MTTSLQLIIRSTSCLILVYGFRGRRIEWTYFRLDQMHEASACHLGKILSDHISGMGYPIHFHELESALEEYRRK